MTDHVVGIKKDLGQQREVMDSLPYAVAGGAWAGSFQAMLAPGAFFTPLLHVVPHGKQFKLLFLRVWTQANGAYFRIVQTNPTAAGQTGSVEAFPVVGNVPSGVRDYPMLEAAGAEVLHGSLVDPIHVLEGSFIFQVAGPVAASGNLYSIDYWGVEKDLPVK